MAVWLIDAPTTLPRALAGGGVERVMEDCLHPYHYPLPLPTNLSSSPSGITFPSTFSPKLCGLVWTVGQLFLVHQIVIELFWLWRPIRLLNSAIKLSHFEVKSLDFTNESCVCTTKLLIIHCYQVFSSGFIVFRNIRLINQKRFLTSLSKSNYQITIERFQIT